jgi:hypothetical protein
MLLLLILQHATGNGTSNSAQETVATEFVSGESSGQTSCERTT